ncbi:MAG: tetratricopeptide repeat protein [Acidobacteria bacterium]|nr:tetratricopeptide repeat protein [Acidobacteriota bacterium]
MPVRFGLASMSVRLFYFRRLNLEKVKDGNNMKRICSINFRRTVAVSMLVFCVVFAANCSRGKLPPNAGQLPPNAEQLVLGQPVTKPLKNDEVHSYTVNLDEGQFLGLSVEQHDVDVITKVFAPNGELLGEFDTPTSGRGTELIRIGAETSGHYRFDFYTLSAGAEPGRYTLQQTALRSITERDRKILSAVKFHQQADILRAKPETRRDSLPIYEKAIQIWREVGELADEGNTHRAMGFACQRLEDIEGAKHHFGLALEIWERIGDLRSAAFTHVIFGVIHKKQNEYAAGLKEDLTALPLWEKAGDAPEYTQNLVRIGNDYVKLQNREETISYFERALEASGKVESKGLKAYVLGQYGDARAAFGDKTKARDFYQQALTLWEALKQDKAVNGLKEKIDKLQS